MDFTDFYGILAEFRRKFRLFGRPFVRSFVRPSVRPLNSAEFPPLNLAENVTDVFLLVSTSISTSHLSPGVDLHLSPGVDLHFCVNFCAVRDIFKITALKEMN